MSTTRKVCASSYLVLALCLILEATPDAWGDGMVSTSSLMAPPSPIPYSSTGTIGISGITGTNVVSYVGFTQASFYDLSSFGGPMPPQINLPGVDQPGISFVLGSFRLSGLPQGLSTTYDNTPFSVTLNIQGVAPITLTGTLNGTAAGSDQSSVLVDVNRFATMALGGGAQEPIDLAHPFAFTSGNSVNWIYLLSGNEVRIRAPDEPFSLDGAFLRGAISPQTVPEPTVLVLAFTVIAGAGARQLSRFRKK